MITFHLTLFGYIGIYMYDKVKHRKVEAMWRKKTFKTYEKLEAWVAKHGDSYQWEQIFIHNGYAVEYKRLRVIRFPE